MKTVRVTGSVDENHRLSALVPADMPPGLVTILVVPVSEEDAAGHGWSEGVAREWSDELSDPRQDIYTLEDGESVD